MTRIFVKEEQAAPFYEYIQSIESDFHAEFPNAGMLMYYTFKDKICPVPCYTEGSVCVAILPPVVVRWLLAREDCPKFLSELLYTLDSRNLPVYPTWDDVGMETGEHFTIELDRRTKDKIYGKNNRWVVEVCYITKPATPFYYILDCLYNERTHKFVHADFMDRESLGVAAEMGSTKKLKSLKAVYNFIRKQKFPVGTYIKVHEYKDIFNQFYLRIKK